MEIVMEIEKYICGNMWFCMYSRGAALALQLFCRIHTEEGGGLRFEIPSGIVGRNAKWQQREKLY